MGAKLVYKTFQTKGVSQGRSIDRYSLDVRLVSQTNTGIYVTKNGIGPAIDYFLFTFQIIQ